MSEIICFLWLGGEGQMQSLIIKSADSSSTVILTPRALRFEEETFLCELSADNFYGKIVVESSYRDQISKYFLELSSNWRGWEGERLWVSSGAELRLVATSDKTGHIRISVTIKTYIGEQLTIPIMVEAGTVASLAVSASELFD